MKADRVNLRSHGRFFCEGGWAGFRPVEASNRGAVQRKSLPNSLIVRFELWKSSIDRQWYWHLKGEKNEKLAQGEAYASKDACLEAIEQVRKSSAAAMQDLSSKEREAGV